MVHRRLKRLRRLSGLTQYELAAKAGVGRTRLCLFECGHIPLADQEIAAIERALTRTIQARVTQVNGLLSEKALAV